MFYKHFEVYMYDREPVIVTGKSRSQVGRDFKRIYGHDAVDEVKPISGRSVESRYGFEYKQIVKANTMVNTPNGNDPYINESTMELKSYGFYEVKLVGTDETEIVIGSSLEKVKAEMEEAFGDMLDSVSPVSGDELTSDDPTDPDKNHQMNVSILSGRNPFSESVDEMTDLAKKAMHPSGTGKTAFADKKDKLKKDLAAMKARSNKEVTKEDVDSLNEISMDKLRSYHGKAIKQGVAKGVGTTEPRKDNPKLNRYVPPTQKDKELSSKRMKGAAKAANLMAKKRKETNEELEEGSVTYAHSKAAGYGKADHHDQAREIHTDHVRTHAANGRSPNKELYDAHLAANRAHGDARDAHENDHPNKTAMGKKANQLSNKAFKMSDKHNASQNEEVENVEEKRGLWDNIHAKRKRIKNGSGERMRKPGSKGAPSNQDFKDSQKEDVQEDVLAEGADKLMYLARIGLMNKNELVLLRRAMSQRSSGKPISVQTRKILFKLLDKMVSLVIKNPHMFNQAKRKVMEAAWDEALGDLQDQELTETFIQRIDYLREAGYMDQPKTKAEVKKKFPDVETDVKNKDSKELQPVKYK